MKNKMINKFIDKAVPVFGKIGSEIHLLAVRDALMSLIPFLALAGLSIFFRYILFTETSFVGKMMDPDTLATIGGLFQRIVTGTIGLMSVMLVTMVAYFMGKQRGYANPLILAVTSLALFFVFTPLAGGSDYFGTKGAILAMIIGLTSSELFMKLAKNKKLQMNVGDNVPQAVKNSFNVVIIVFILLFIYSAVATTLSAISGMEAMDLINAILQKPLVNIGATLPGAIVYTLVQTILWAFGIHAGAVVAPMEAIFTSALLEGKIVNYSFLTTYGQIGGTGSCMGLLIVLMFLVKRKELKAVGKLSAIADIFNINEPLSFGVPIVFNPVLMIPFIMVPIINTVLAYIATSINLISKMSNVITWSTPIFFKGYIGSNGDFRNVLMELVCLLLDIVIWFVFVKIYETQLDKEGSLGI